MKYETERREIAKACLDMNRRGINQGTSGNISVRVKEGFLLTPSGIAYDEMKPSDIVLMKPDASHVGKRKPSSEWRFHHALMKTRPEIGAVVHTHAMFATTLSCLGMEIPAVHYMIAAAGGENIRCAPYATYGTQETADLAVKALQDRNACLLVQSRHDRRRAEPQEGDVAGGRSGNARRAILARAAGRQAQYPAQGGDQPRHRQVQDLWPSQGACAGVLLIHSASGPTADPA